MLWGGNSCLRHAIENRFDSDATCPMGYKKDELSLQMSLPFPRSLHPSLPLFMCVLVLSIWAARVS